MDKKIMTQRVIYNLLYSSVFTVFLIAIVMLKPTLVEGKSVVVTTPPAPTLATVDPGAIKLYFTDDPIPCSKLGTLSYIPRSYPPQIVFKPFNIISQFSRPTPQYDPPLDLSPCSNVTLIGGRFPENYITNPTRVLTWYEGISGFAQLVVNSGAYANADYNADVVNKSTGISITDGERVPVGTTFSLRGDKGNVSWHFTGGLNDTPYGYWVPGAENPSVRCSGSDYTFRSQVAFVYLPFSAAPPVISYSHDGKASLSCSPAGDECTVLSPGEVNLSVNFSQTYGKLYFQYIVDGPRSTCIYSKTPLSPGYNFIFPPADIAFNFTAFDPSKPASTNNPPDVSLRYSPNTSPHPLTNEEVTLYITGVDPDPGDKVQYQIDLIDDGKQEAQYFLPSPSTYTNSGTELSMKKTWIDPGTQNIWVKAIDDKGGESDWKLYQITVTNPCGNNTIDSGEQCDGTNLNGQSCTTINQGFTGGTLSCGSCTFNTSNCNNNPVCPNNKKERGEDCDGTDLGGALCPNGLLGMPTCNSDCTINNNNTCYPAVCGDGIKEGVKEECDKGPSNGNRTSGCSKDCKIVPVLPACLVNGRCETFNGENFSNCPKDCPSTIIETRAPKPSFWAFVLGALGFR